jgi:hypothetical protein
MPLAEHNSREYVANHENVAVSPADVLAATTLEDLVPRAAQ